MGTASRHRGVSLEGEGRYVKKMTSSRGSFTGAKRYLSVVLGCLCVVYRLSLFFFFFLRLYASLILLPGNKVQLSAENC